MARLIGNIIDSSHFDAPQCKIQKNLWFICFFCSVFRIFAKRLIISHLQTDKSIKGFQRSVKYFSAAAVTHFSGRWNTLRRPPNSCYPGRNSLFPWQKVPFSPAVSPSPIHIKLFSSTSKDSEGTKILFVLFEFFDVPFSISKGFFDVKNKISVISPSSSISILIN